jgi:hypothetical protein
MQKLLPGGVEEMPKDGQVDKKEVRMEKANGQIPLTRENMNQNSNAKKQSVHNASTPGDDKKGG